MKKQILIVMMLGIIFSLWPDHTSFADNYNFNERKQQLIEKCIAYYEPYYNSDLHLVQDPQGSSDYYTRDAIWLAQCYLQDVNKTSDDINTVNELLRNAFQLQIKTGSDKGLFVKVYGDLAVTDKNVVVFSVPSLAYIFNHYYADLENDVQDELVDVLNLAEIGIRNMEDDVPLWYGNIYLGMIDAMVGLGNESQALEWTNRYYEFTKQFGINEYSSHNYDIVQLAALQNAYSEASNSTLQNKLKELVEFHWYMLVHNVEPNSKMISSVSSRAKGSSGSETNTSVLTALYLYLEEGSLSLIDKPRVELLLSNYQPIQNVKGIYYNKKHAASTSWQAHFSRVDVQVFSNDEFSLSTQSGRRSSLGITNTTKKQLSGEEQELDLQIIANNGSKRDGVYFQTDDIPRGEDDFNHHWITSVQHENKAIISYNFDPKGATDKEIYSKGYLGLKGRIAPGGNYNNIRINNSTWDGTDIALSTSDILTYRLGDTYIGIRFLESDVISITGHAVATNSLPIVLKEETVDSEQVFTLTNYVLYSKSNVSLIESDRRMGYAIRLEKADGMSHNDFYSLLSGMSKAQKFSGGLHSINFSDNVDELYIQEDLSTNTIHSRQVNDTEFDNNYLLKSNYVSYSLDDNLSKTVRVSGTLSYPNWQVPAISNKYLYIEAEDMVLDGFLQNNRVGASNGKTIFVPVTSTTPDNPFTAGIGVNIPHTDDWRVWYRVYFSGGGSNSFYHKFNKDNAGFNHNKVEGYTYNSFEWIDVPLRYLHRGTHFINNHGKEANSEIDRILITNDLSFNPN
ncbi:hypothetical protein ACH6EH_03490 [Paenibacillus sp. JSM ZJ436]|uniref:hypothetical protein n=1 Tax=Paenibacillus sp. JSM ZJ436 TaxID=3376190 RepID=UPI0037BBEC57